MYFYPVLTNKYFLLSYECILCLEFYGSGTELRSLNILCTLPLSLIYDLKSMHPMYVKTSAVDLIS